MPPDQGPDRVVVLHTVETVQPSLVLNPFVALQIESLPDDVEVRLFSWRRALLGRYDVLHVQWPENLGHRPGRGHALARPLVMAALRARLRIRSIPVVQTKHNLEPHEPLSPRERRQVRAWDRLTSTWIVLNERTPTPPGVSRVLLPHGHYRGWYRGDEAVVREPGRLLYFGLVRPYKGVEGLIAAFGGLPEPGPYRLHVLGAPWDAATATAIEKAAAGDDRIRLSLRFATAEELADAVHAASVVVLPYRELHNSGALLLALSLDRPVIVPRTAATEDLVAEFGRRWVLAYDGPLTASLLAELVGEAERGLAQGGSPDLSAREWPLLGSRLAAVYRDAVRRAGPGRRRGA